MAMLCRRKGSIAVGWRFHGQDRIGEVWPCCVALEVGSRFHCQDKSGEGQLGVQSKRNPILDLKKHKANSIHKRVQLICQAKCMILSRKSIYVHSVVKSAMLFNVLVAVLSSHSPMPIASPTSHAILLSCPPTPTASLSSPCQ